MVKLLIPSDAKRHTPIGRRKCRCEFAEVLEIINANGNKIKSAMSTYDNNFKYNTGETVVPNSYDPDPLKECSNGIHFFISKLEAKEY